MSRASLRACGLVVALATALAVPSSPALAGTIGFRTEAEVTAGDGLDARVTLTHTGDEAATSVRVKAELDGRAIEGESVPTMGPGEARTWNFRLADKAETGQHVAVLRATYSDANGYPFEIVSIATAPVRVQAAPKIFGNLAVPRIPVSGEVDGRLTAKRPAGRQGPARARLVVPSGLEVVPSEIVLDFDAEGRAVVDFVLRNRKLLAGTSVNIFALVTASDPGFPQTDVVRGTVSVGEKKEKSAPPSFYGLAAALFALLAILEAWGFARGRRATEATP